MDNIQILKINENFIKQKYKVRKIGIFGSSVRGDSGERSDVDVLVEFEEGYKTFDNYMDLLFFLEDLYSRKVDLITTMGLDPYIRPYVEKEVVWG
jgi:predicted nucleotidyltransferase